MLIDWNNFTPWLSLSGGLALGTAVALLLLFNGRIAGISGILGGLLGGLFGGAPGERAWRVAFLAALLASPLVYVAVHPLPAIEVDAGYPVLIAAGLLVGFGARLGSGCTSGHGVCGVARLSPRSLAATALFMCAGFATVFVVRHLA